MENKQKKYIVECNAGEEWAPLKGYMCQTNISKSYSAGVMEFDTPEKAQAEADRREIKVVKIIEV